MVKITVKCKIASIFDCIYIICISNIFLEKIKHYFFCEELEYDLYMNNYYNKLNEEDKYLVNIINTHKDFHLYNLGGSPVRNYILDIH